MEHARCSRLHHLRWANRARQFFVGVCVVFLLPVPLDVQAEDLTAEQVRTALVGFLNQTQSYQADFQQTVYDANGAVVDDGSGQFWLLRPGNLRWHYKLPWERDIVATGDRIWVHDAELEQVTIRDTGEALSSTPAALLIGDTDALDEYELSGASEGMNISRLRLIPKGAGGDFAEIGLVLIRDELRQLILFDRFGQQTVIQFTDIIANAPIEAKIFEFEPPASADIIDESSL